MRHGRWLLALALLCGVAPQVAASIADDPEPIPGAGSTMTITDDINPTSAAQHFRESTGWAGEVITRTTIDEDGLLVHRSMAVVFTSPLSACDDAKDCAARIEKACREEGKSVKSGSVKLKQGESCSGQCAGLQLVQVEVTCPKPPDVGPTQTQGIYDPPDPVGRTSPFPVKQ